jgi:uncharacterized protein (DUF1778 family)
MGNAARRTARWEFRVTADANALVRRAAHLSGRTVTDFVVAAAVVEADGVLRDRTRFVVEEGEWARFVEVLDRAPQDNPGLVKLFSKSSVVE